MNGVDMRRRRTLEIVAALMAGALMTGIVACGGQDKSNNGDLKGVLFHRPDKIEGYTNVDGQPNLVRLCIDGVAFMTTSRDYSSTIRVPEWDHWCGGATK
jgi:hypothetical protein